MKTHSNGSGIVSRLFFKLLPIQILIVAMGSVNSIVDGVIAGRFIAPSSVGALELLRDKIQITLDQCRSVVMHRTPFTITQERVEIEWV